MNEIDNFKSDYNNCISVYIPATMSVDEIINKLDSEIQTHKNKCIIDMIVEIKSIIKDCKNNTSMIIFMHPTQFDVFINYTIESYKFIIDNKFHGVP